MSRHKQSSMALTLFKQQLKHIDFQLRRFWQGDPVGGRRTERRFADPNSGPLTQRHDLGNGRIAIEYCEGFAALHCAEEFAEFCLEFGDADLFHDYI